MTEIGLMVCRGCGSTEERRQEAMDNGALNCCPERAMNDAIERDHGIPAMEPVKAHIPIASAIAAIIDPPAWTDREKRTDKHRRTSSLKRARQIQDVMRGAPYRSETRQLQKALLMAACHCQGGHSDAGIEISTALGVPFPITMEALEIRAVELGFEPRGLWPWLFRMREQAKAAKARGNGD